MEIWVDLSTIIRQFKVISDEGENIPKMLKGAVVCN
jgi:hypothetical protein